MVKINLKLEEEIVNRLIKLKKVKESYDDVIKKLLDKYKEKETK